MRTLIVAALVAAAVVAAAPPRRAEGAADANGSLANGGTLVGDISKTVGEKDTIGVDLVAGSKINVKWSSAFSANVVFTDPNGAAIDLGLTGSRAKSVPGVAVPSTGHYELRVSSADGSQGTYSLQVLPYWDKTVTLTGMGNTTFDLPMPASSVVKGKVQPAPGASNPSILSLVTPSGSDLLIAPIVGSVGLAKLKPVACPTQGVYRFTATATAGTTGFTATLSRKAPKVALVKADIRNGIAQVSYAKDGVSTYFNQHCASCHSWAGTYPGVRAYARSSLDRMRSGNMPLGGPRADNATLTLVNDWITTGYGK